MKIWGVVLLVLLVAPWAVSAQTSTPSPTLTPDVRQMWTVEAGVNALGTPIPPMDVVFSYSFHAGDVPIALLLLLLLIVIWLMYWSLKLMKRKER